MVTPGAAPSALVKPLVLSLSTITSSPSVAVAVLFAVNGMLIGGNGGALPSLREKLQIDDGHIAVIHDLGSTNGTTVNGTVVQTWQLADGDVIRLGHSTIIFSQRG